MADLLSHKDFSAGNFALYPIGMDGNPEDGDDVEDEPEEEYVDAEQDRGRPTILEAVSCAINEVENGNFGELDPGSELVKEFVENALGFEYQVDISFRSSTSAVDPDTTLELKLEDLMPERYKGEKDQDRVIKAKGTIQYVVMRRKKPSDEEEQEHNRGQQLTHKQRSQCSPRLLKHVGGCPYPGFSSKQAYSDA